MSGKSFLRFLFGAAKSTPAPRMPSIEAVEKLEARALQAEKLIDFLKVEVANLQKSVETNKISESSFVNKKQYEDLLRENQKLRQEIEHWKKQLISTEEKLNIIQVDVGTSIKESSILKERLDTLQEQQQAVQSEEESKLSEKKKEKVKPAKPADTTKKTAAASADKPVDVGRLDIRVGKIVSVIKHPDADSLYVEDVDLGEGKPRTVVSGLVKFVPIEQLQNKMVVVLCNLKPAKMKGVTSEAMVLCASTPDKVEPLVPPKDAAPGDRIRVEGFQQEPDDVLNPKKKIFETVAVDLKTDNMKNATYKGKPFYIPGKGFITAPTLVNVNIK